MRVKYPPPPNIPTYRFATMYLYIIPSRRFTDRQKITDRNNDSILYLYKYIRIQIKLFPIKITATRSDLSDNLDVIIKLAMKIPCNWTVISKYRIFESCSFHAIYIIHNISRYCINKMCVGSPTKFWNKYISLVSSTSYLTQSNTLKGSKRKQ